MKKAEFNSFDEVLIEVTGLGGGINYHVALTQAVFELAGFKVEVDNKHNDPSDAGFFDKEKMKEIIRADAFLKSKKPLKIKLVASHLPWPG